MLCTHGPVLPSFPEIQLWPALFVLQSVLSAPPIWLIVSSLIHAHKRLVHLLCPLNNAAWWPDGSLVTYML